jgi:hypothetical protein
MRHNRRIGDPKHALGKPELIEGGCNAIDSHGRAYGRLARASHGQLVVIFDGEPRPVSEARFAQVLKFWWEHPTL